MTSAQRRNKLKVAENMLKQTHKRIRRLMTSEKLWARRVKMHAQALEVEEAAELEAAKAALPPTKAQQFKDRLLLPPVEGRKFRD